MAATSRSAFYFRDSVGIELQIALGWVSWCISRGIGGAPGITLEAVSDNSSLEGSDVCAKSSA